jgi:hypothetical protein
LIAVADTTSAAAGTPLKCRLGAADIADLLGAADQSSSERKRKPLQQNTFS